MTGDPNSRALAATALALLDAGALDRVCAALTAGKLVRESQSATRTSLAEGHPLADSAIRDLLAVWKLHSALSEPALVVALRAAADAAILVREQSPVTEIVWTGPRVESSFIRATREVVRELVRQAKRELLVVGYWIAATDDGEGIIEELIASLADAVRRGVRVTVVADERPRADGRDNKQILLAAWPSGVPSPRVLTWRLPSDDHHLKLHAKVLVGDREDALVTSANLTFYAMDRNIEMGVRIVGAPGREIARHFELLAASGVLQPFSDVDSRR